MTVSSACSQPFSRNHAEQTRPRRHHRSTACRGKHHYHSRLASSGSPATDRVQVIRLVVKAVSNTDVDLGQKGFSQGDQEIVRYDVFQSGKKIGEAGEVCQFTRVTKAFITNLCQAALTLPKG